MLGPGDLQDFDDTVLKSLGGVDALVQGLGTDPKKGLSSEQVAASRRRFGSNKLPDKELTSFWEHLWEAFQDRTVIILVISAVVQVLFAVFVR